MDSTNSKALFRRGQAYVNLSEFKLGLADLQQALETCPNNKDIIREISKLKEMENSYLEIEKATCQKMFN